MLFCEPKHIGGKCFMIPAFFINLDRHPHRRAHLERQLAAIGFFAERVAGVNGRNIPPEIAKNFSFADYLTPGQVGCSASHLTALRIIRDRGIPAALILEDDAIIPPELAAVIAEVMSALPNGWDLVRLCRRAKRAVKPIAQLSNGRQLVRYSRIPVGSAGYLISTTGAAKLLAPRHFDCPNDVEITRCWRLGLDVYGVDPPPIIQERDVLPSTIGDNRGNLPRWQKMLPNPTRFAFNIRQLGPYWWGKCLMTNATRKLRPAMQPDPESISG